MMTLFVLSGFIVSLLLTGMVRFYALKKALLDIPNARSSHTIPTPRTGGLAIIITFFCGIFWLWQQHILLTSQLFACFGAIPVAIIGYLDDVKKVSAKSRALVHLCSAVWAVYCLHGFPVADFGSKQFFIGNFGAVLAVIAVMWCINLYNFMDGIDGFAGSEGLFISICAAIFLATKSDWSLVYLNLLLVAAIAGFLIWNWPPAKIFMGDIGSGFLGYIFALIALSSMRQHEGSVTFWVLLFALFIFDATATLIYRFWHKQALYEAHREHAYQKFIIAGATHSQVTIGLILLNIFIMAPAAITVLAFPKLSLLVLAAVTLGLLALWLFSRKINLKN